MLGMKTVVRGRTTTILTGWTVVAVFAALLLAAVDGALFRHWLPLTAFLLTYGFVVWCLSRVRKPSRESYHQPRRLEEKLSILRRISDRSGRGSLESSRLVEDGTVVS